MVEANGYELTIHAMERMAERDVTVDEVADCIREGRHVTMSSSKYELYDKKNRERKRLQVVVDAEERKVVTVYRKTAIPSRTNRTEYKFFRRQHEQ